MAQSLVQTKIADSFAVQGFMRLIGARLLEAGAGRCVIEADWREDLTQQHGFFHAGVTATLADNVCGYAAYSLMPEGCSVLTVEFKINLTNPAKGQRIRAVGEVIKPGRTLMITRATVHAVEDGVEKACAESLSTVMVMQGMADRGA